MLQLLLSHTFQRTRNSISIVASSQGRPMCEIQTLINGSIIKLQQTNVSILLPFITITKCFITYYFDIIHLLLLLIMIILMIMFNKLRDDIIITIITITTGTFKHISTLYTTFLLLQTTFITRFRAVSSARDLILATLLSCHAVTIFSNNTTT